MEAIDLAKYIVSKCTKDGHPITNIQLQKILCCIQNRYLSYNTQAFFDKIELWSFGFCVPNVYYYFCGFGVMPITLTYDIHIDSKDVAIVNPIVEEKRKLLPWEWMKGNLV